MGNVSSDLPCKFGQTYMNVMFTVLIFGQIQSLKKINVYSPLPFSVILQGGFRSSLFGQVNNPLLKQPDLNQKSRNLLF